MSPIENKMRMLEPVDQSRDPRQLIIDEHLRLISKCSYKPNFVIALGVFNLRHGQVVSRKNGATR
jgi:hypothetical protein